MDHASQHKQDNNEAEIKATPVTLVPGEQTDFPTWGGGRLTRMSFQNLSSTDDGTAFVQVGGGGEEVKVPKGKTVQIDRDWHTVRAGVSNTSKAANLKVWTA